MGVIVVAAIVAVALGLVMVRARRRRSSAVPIAIEERERDTLRIAQVATPRPLSFARTACGELVAREPIVRLATPVP